MPNPSDVRRSKGTLRHTVDQLMLVDLLRYFVVALRYIWFVYVLRRMKTLRPGAGADEAVAENTVSHNLRGLRDLAVNRSHLLVRPLSVVEWLDAGARVLSVGPRSEGELLSLAAHGFTWSRIEALDLISYSPKVRLGDMHRTDYPDATFDAIVLGWVIAYSEEPARAAREMVRITRPGGLIAVGVEYSPRSQDDIIAELGYLPGAKKRIGSCDEILALFGDAVEHVYWKHVIAPDRADRQGNLCVLFSVRHGVAAA
jgi:SAM-dependent methyltransferase